MRLELPFRETDEHISSRECVIHGGLDRVWLKIVVTIVQSALPAVYTIGCPSVNC
jgi:hypothetical protein